MPNIIVLGDFNFPIIDWDTGIVSGGTIEMQNQANSQFNFMGHLMLEQMIHESTRGDNILDLFMTNNIDLVQSVQIKDTEMSDHRIITLLCNLGLQASKEDQPKYRNVLGSLNFMSENIQWDMMKLEFREVNWGGLIGNCNAEDMYGALCTRLTDICTKYVPPRRKKIISRIPRDRKILMRKRRKIEQKIDRELNPRVTAKLKAEYEQAEAALIPSHKQKAQDRENRALIAIKRNKKYY